MPAAELADIARQLRGWSERHKLAAIKDEGWLKGFHEGQSLAYGTAARCIEDMLTEKAA